MNYPFKGGKGKVAPYITTHCRVPEPIKFLIDCIINEWKRRLQSDDDPEGKILIERLRQAHLSGVFDSTTEPLTLDEAIQVANLILEENAKSKKSTKVVMSKLLTAIYKTKTTLQ